MRDLTSKPLIVAKGLMFLGLAGLTAGLLFAGSPSIKTAVVLAVLIWSACRFYYFLFYVLQHYVDPELRYAGLLGLLGQIRRRRGSRREG